MSHHYRVVWQIDIAADSPLEAAIAARKIQERRDSIAHVYDVVKMKGGEATSALRIDLDELNRTPI